MPCFINTLGSLLFLKGNRGTVDLGERWGSIGRSGGKGGCGQYVLYRRRINKKKNEKMNFKKTVKQSKQNCKYLIQMYCF